MGHMGATPHFYLFVAGKITSFVLAVDVHVSGGCCINIRRCMSTSTAKNIFGGVCQIWRWMFTLAVDVEKFGGGCCHFGGG